MLHKESEDETHYSEQHVLSLRTKKDLCGKQRLATSTLNFHSDCEQTDSYLFVRTL